MTWSIIPEPSVAECEAYSIVADNLIAIDASGGRFRVVIVEHEGQRRTCDATLRAMMPARAFDNPIPEHFEVVEG